MEESKGSEWRKWDFHVHTPASVFNNQFGDWDQYVKMLFTKAIRNNVSAIGITDYYIPEGYFKLKREYLENEGKLRDVFTDEEVDKIRKIYVFPNIEFRINKLISSDNEVKGWGHKFNYHLLLCGDLDLDIIENDIISQLSIEFDANIGEENERRSLSKKNIEALGKRLKAEHQKFKGSDFYIGACNASINESELAKLLKGNKGLINKYMLGIPSDEDLSEVSWDAQSHSIRKNLIKQCHFIFSSNQKTVDFMLGRYNKIQHLSEFGALKPCLWGSDAHDLDKMFEPDLNRHTWIKADLTFSGLKQVVYDPELRVRIQENNPQNKNDYQIIKRARFVDKSGRDVFTSDWINFNPDLTTIIGGKSSGKSLLLYNLARANNPQEVEDKLAIVNEQNYKKKGEYDFEVEWNNGDVCKLSDGDNVKPITYIPQLYINHLAEKEGKKDLNEIISKVMCQNKEFKINLDCSREEISRHNINISTKLSELLACIEQVANIKKQSLEVGVKTDIEREQKSINKDIEEIRNKSGFNPTEQALYSNLLKRRSSIVKRRVFFEEVEAATQSFINSYIKNCDTAFQSLITNIKRELSCNPDSTIINSYSSLVHSSLEQAYHLILKGTGDKTKRVKGWIKKLLLEQEDLDSKILPFSTKVTEQARLKELTDKLIIEEGKIKFISEKEQEEKNKIELGKVVKKSLLDSYNSIITIYESIASLINSPSNYFDDEIRVKAEVVYDSDQFQAFIDLFDRRVSLVGFMEGILDDKGQVSYSPDRHAEQVQGIYEKIRVGKNIPKLKSGVTNQDLYRKLYSDCFRIDYSVFYRNDEIVQMSPGKRGLVLMSILLHLSNSGHPILIDQPEDNLDNRTIYDQLKEYMRVKKFDRQIIMVTHNANLVVSTDSECIIVANQAGQQNGHENEKYQFEYCCGSLENDIVKSKREGILFKNSIRDHVCHILEGGVKAFKEREIKYGMKH